MSHSVDENKFCFVIPDINNNFYTFIKPLYDLHDMLRITLALHNILWNMSVQLIFNIIYTAEMVF